jgi:hypothetical protein
MTRVALYARYSSDQQREASIEDQMRLCRMHAEKQSWWWPTATMTGPYPAPRSSAPASRRCSRMRCADASSVVLAEALDRISRDQEDVAGVFKRMATD